MEVSLNGGTLQQEHPICRHNLSAPGWCQKLANLRVRPHLCFFSNFRHEVRYLEAKRKGNLAFERPNAGPDFAFADLNKHGLGRVSGWYSR